jgi:hypothetical protein
MSKVMIVLVSAQRMQNIIPVYQLFMNARRSHDDAHLWPFSHPQKSGDLPLGSW